MRIWSFVYLICMGKNAEREFLYHLLNTYLNLRVLLERLGGASMPNQILMKVEFDVASFHGPVLLLSSSYYMGFVHEEKFGKLGRLLKSIPPLGFGPMVKEVHHMMCRRCVSRVPTLLRTKLWHISWRKA